MLNGCELFAEVGEDRIDLRSNETLELIDDFKRFQMDHYQANFDRFHLIREDASNTMKVCDAAFYLYRERFLAHKYGPEVIEVTIKPANDYEPHCS